MPTVSLELTDEQATRIQAALNYNNISGVPATLDDFKHFKQFLIEHTKAMVLRAESDAASRAITPPDIT
jgi:hypothetical protein